MPSFLAAKTIGDIQWYALVRCFPALASYIFNSSLAQALLVQLGVALSGLVTYLPAVARSYAGLP